MYGKHGTPRGTARKNNVTGSFFENHVLGIMACLSDTINESKGMQIVAEKMRCLRAIQEMIKIAKGNVNNALPQVHTHCPGEGSYMKADEIMHRSLHVCALPSKIQSSATKHL